MLRRVVLVSLVTGFGLMVAAPVSAKGVSSASIEGPGLKEPLVIEETTGGGSLSRLVEASGFWQLLYGSEDPSHASGTMLSQAPAGDLGPEYVVTWYLGEDPYPAPSSVYPLAPGGPLVYVEVGKTGGYFGIDTVPGGWFAADPILIELMAGYGVPVGVTKARNSPLVEPAQVPVEPVVAPSTVPSAIPVSAAVAALGILVVGGGAWATGRRPRRAGAP